MVFCQMAHSKATQILQESEAMLECMAKLDFFKDATKYFSIYFKEWALYFCCYMLGKHLVFTPFMEWMGLVRSFCWAVVRVLVACWVTLSNDYAIGSTLLCCVLRQKYCCAFALCACDNDAMRWMLALILWSDVVGLLR